MTPEGKVKNEIKKLLSNYDVYYNMPVAGTMGRSGVLDFQCCVGGQYLAIEAKANGGKPTALQKHELAKVEKAGGIAMVVDENNLDELATVIVELLRKDSL